MARTMTLDAEAAIAAPHAISALLVELEFPSGVVRFNSSDVTVQRDGDDYLGAARCSGIEPVQETAAPVAQALNLRFTGLDPAYMAAILDDDWLDAPARIYVAHWDAGTAQLVDAPTLVFQGVMDEPLVSVGETATIQVALENPMADWDRARLRRYNDADQQARYSGDKFFEFVEELQSKELVWGIYKGPPAPDPLKLFNRTLDRITNFKIAGIPTAPGAKLVVNAARKVGDAIGKVFGW